MNAVAFVRLVADWLGNASTGINARLATIPLDGTDVAPAALTVLDETRDLDTALGRLPEATSRPCAQVALTAESEETPPSQSVPTREFTATVGIRLALSNAQAASGARDLYYYAKATLESLRALHAADETGRTRGQVYLEAPTDTLRIATMGVIEHDETVTALITVRYTGRDQS